jgi:hypothetical protein
MAPFSFGEARAPQAYTPAIMSKRRTAPSEKSATTPVSRLDFTSFVDECNAKLDLQFKRIAQIQAELDHIRAAWKGTDRRKK